MEDAAALGMSCETQQAPLGGSTPKAGGLQTSAKVVGSSNQAGLSLIRNPARRDSFAGVIDRESQEREIRSKVG